ncbi:MAG: hypothetical protein H6722_04130 [Sandaracinus sp.]|nr:hypothetical protein [Sandaracinus sp.]
MALELRLFGIPIRIHLMFFLTGLLVWQGFQGPEVGMASLPIALLVVLQAVLMHELGHALAGRAFGLEPQIDLMLMMGQTSWRGGRDLSPGKSMLVSFAGPLVGLVVGGAALAIALLTADPATLTPDPDAVASVPSLRQWTLTTFVYVNLVWSFYNLVPVLPLDGGNIMASFFQLFSKDHGVRAARYVSLVFLALLLALAIAVQAIFLAAFIVMFAFLNVQALRADRELRKAGVPVIRSAEDLLKLAYGALEKGDHETVTQAALVLLKHAGDTPTRDEALHLLAWGRLLAQQPGQAREALDRMSGERDADPALEGSVQLALGRAAEAVELFERALSAGPNEMVVKKWVEAVERAGAFRRAATLVNERRDLVGPKALSRLQASALQAGEHEAAFLLGALAFPIAHEPITAFNAACALVQLGKLDEAARWLEKAHEVGFRDLGLLDGEEDLDALRATREWPALRARFET